MFDELIKKNILSCEEKDNYVKNLNSLNVKMNFEDPINVVLDATDLLITDFSSIITEFFLTNKPIIYCKKNIEFNESGKKLEKFMYETHSWDEIENYCFKLIDDGDVLRTDRQKFIEQEFSDIQNSSKKIVDRIIKDYRS
jgi:CDP-glycerol glycerophosphotransferase (TagB/SpsB family)